MYYYKSGCDIMKKSIPIVEWYRMSQDGAVPPMRIQVNGSSMYPLIRIRKDYVTIAQIETKPVPGDIILFSDPETDARYVVHRVWKTRGNSVLTWGDNCPKSDGWIPINNVWGKVALIERGERRIHPHPRLGIIWGWIWHQAMKAYRFREKIKTIIRRSNQQ